ncbi:hypothetical protein [Aliihoeflea sp. 2WW]|uniref:Y-family DNA polymerase n=1 Tax=Aliihoeflea sp. 2WW TaxID=1381123 RepID=UPI0004B72243|nr:hypothetical protein [Aliihoeflea sp. 2WW]
MGQRLHHFRNKVRQYGIRVLSGNYTFYSDMSRRVVDAINSLSPAVEVYSIDETFVDLSGFGSRMLDHATKMRATVRRLTGIPACVGIGPTKTLAKLANHAAKKNPVFGGVADFMDERIRTNCMQRIAVGEVWGVGSRTVTKLAVHGVVTVVQLAAMPRELARKVGTVVLERTVAELQGIRCLDLEDVEPQRKGMAVTRSPGMPITELDTMLRGNHSSCHLSSRAAMPWLGRGHVDSFLPHKPALARRAEAPRFEEAGVMLDDLFSPENAPTMLFDFGRDRRNSWMPSMR